MQPSACPVESSPAWYTMASARGSSRSAAAAWLASAPSVSADRYRAPRMTAVDSPDSRKDPCATRNGAMPAAAARSKMVEPGCHSSGSTRLSQRRALSSRPVPGTATW